MILERLYRWALVRQLLAEAPADVTLERAEVDRLVARELAAVPASIVEHYRYQDREARILNDRLARRYDPGQAVNEAANRAIQAKQASGERSPDNLTDKQKLALEFQKAHLQRVIKDS